MAIPTSKSSIPQIITQNLCPNRRGYSALSFLFFGLALYILFDIDLRLPPDDTNTSTNISREQLDPQEQHECPLAVQKNAGIFQSNNASGDSSPFRDVILVVSCNYAYYDLLQNWEYLATELGLKWAVLALDEELYDKLGPEHAISPGHQHSVSGEIKFQRDNFQKLSCNKMRMVLSIAENCNVDVVFTDVDNIFYRNPFDHDLGRLIQSRHFDYVYQPNINSDDGPRSNRCLTTGPDIEANTGFYYLNRQSTFLKQVMESTLDACAASANHLDDQTLFWQQVWKQKEESNTPFSHCNREEYITINDGPSNANSSAIQVDNSTDFHFCCLDSYYYPIGGPTEKPNPDPITFHANWCVGKKEKIVKLHNSRSDHHGWDASRVERRGLWKWLFGGRGRRRRRLMETNDGGWLFGSRTYKRKLSVSLWDQRHRRPYLSLERSTTNSIKK